MPNLKVIASQDSADGGKSLTGRDGGAALATLNDGELKKQFSQAIESVTSIFEEEAGKNRALKIKEITLKFEITTKGELRLIASAGVEAKGAIELKLSNT